MLTRLLRRAERTGDPEAGIALVFALGVLLVLSIAVGGVIAYSSSSARTATRDDADSKAFSLAEAGLAQGLSVLNEVEDPTASSALSTPRTVAVGNGTVTYSGALNGDVWTITATSRMPNPTGPTAQPIRRTVKMDAEVLGRVSGGEPELWDRIFHNRTDKCLVIDSVSVPSSVTSRGDICLRNSGRILRNSITGNDVVVKAGDDVFIADSGSRIGASTSGQSVTRAEVGGHCAYLSNTPHQPCSSSDKVYAQTIQQEPTSLRKPQVDMDYWYDHAAPGPERGCTTGSFPGGFDNDGSFNGSRATVEITPTGSSYTCKVVENGVLIGELSWNRSSKILTISGTTFIDGDVRFDDDGTRVNYQGRGIIYAGDDVEFDELVCAGGTSSCVNNMSSWDPEQNLLFVISAGWAEYDQGGDLNDDSGFQGAIYSGEFCLIHQAFRSSGPIVCDEIRIQKDDEDQGGGWPSFYSWPALESLVPGVVYGGSDAAEFEILPISQSG
jgi:Tfp pilus assembly protein PilX